MLDHSQNNAVDALKTLQRVIMATKGPASLLASDQALPQIQELNAMIGYGGQRI